MSYDVWAEMDCGGDEPVDVTGGWNYTYNVGAMLRLAMPKTEGIRGLDGWPAVSAAIQIRKGIARMDADPDAYRALNPPNGWGCFDGPDGIRDRLAVLAEQLERVPLAKVVIS